MSKKKTPIEKLFLEEGKLSEAELDYWRAKEPWNFPPDDSTEEAKKDKDDDK